MMKSYLRKALALMLCAALCACLMPTALAEGEAFTFPDGTVIPDGIACPDPAPETAAAEFDDAGGDTLTAAETDLFAASYAGSDGAFSVPAGLTKIEAEAFAGVSGMKSVTIPAGVKEIGDSAFSGCINLSEVIFGGTVAQWKAVKIGSGNEALGRAVILFSDGDHWIPVTAAFFPDAAFRSFVSVNLDTDKNGYLSDAERLAVKTINCAGTEDARGLIQSLRGIELFGNLTTLVCAYNRLSALDLSRNTALETLYCIDNDLTALDLSHNTKLKWLSCSNNSLDALDLSANPALETLYTHYNDLKTLDLSKNPALTGVYAAYNMLGQINLRGNTKLTGLELLGNNLTALDLSGNPKLQKLYCGKNALRGLNVSANPLLELLDLHENSLASLDVSRNTALQDLNVSQNVLTALNVSANTSLRRLQCYTNRLSSLTLGSNSVLQRLNCANNSISSLNISQCPSLLAVYRSLPPVLNNGILYHFTDLDSPYLIFDNGTYLNIGTAGLPISSQVFPDRTFRNLVYQYCDGNKDGYLSGSEISSTTLIYCANAGITTLKGIEYFTALKTLRCYGNPLTELNIRNFPDLKLLECYNTNIRELNIGNNDYLIALVLNVSPIYPGSHVRFYYDENYFLEYTYGVKLTS